MYASTKLFDARGRNILYTRNLFRQSVGQMKGGISYGKTKSRQEAKAGETKGRPKSEAQGRPTPQVISAPGQKENR